MRKGHRFGKSLVGDKFGRLTIVSEAERAGRHRRWNVRCDCGVQLVVYQDPMRDGRTRSCGCLNKEKASARRMTHGKTQTAEYRSWVQMRKRCLSPGDPAYPQYGGRGIKVCERWNRFEHFLADMGPKPSPSHSIDRMRNDGSYEPGNCRWATKKEQAENRGSVHKVQLGNEIVTATEAAKRVGLPAGALQARLRRGWSVQRALSEPKRSWTNGLGKR